MAHQLSRILTSPLLWVWTKLGTLLHAAGNCLATLLHAAGNCLSTCCAVMGALLHAAGNGIATCCAVIDHIGYWLLLQLGTIVQTYVMKPASTAMCGLLRLLSRVVVEIWITVKVTGYNLWFRPKCCP